jgi:uncharacterized protein YggU (UPF0235/DUF167 family)
MNILELQKSLQERGKISFHAKVSPGADKTEWQESLADGTLRLKVKAAPERGQANAEVVSFIASVFGVNKKMVAITAGGGSRLKRIKVKKA